MSWDPFNEPTPEERRTQRRADSAKMKKCESCGQTARWNSHLCGPCGDREAHAFNVARSRYQERQAREERLDELAQRVREAGGFEDIRAALAEVIDYLKET